MNIPELKTTILHQVSNQRNDAQAVQALCTAYNQLVQAEAHELAMRPITTRDLTPAELEPPKVCVGSTATKVLPRKVG